MEIQKRCKYCGRSFIAHKMTTIYCSPSKNKSLLQEEHSERCLQTYLIRLE